jgi:hypothetical protein
MFWIPVVSVHFRSLLCEEQGPTPDLFFADRQNEVFLHAEELVFAMELPYILL